MKVLEIFSTIFAVALIIVTLFIVYNSESNIKVYRIDGEVPIAYNDIPTSLDFYDSKYKLYFTILFNDSAKTVLTTIPQDVLYDSAKTKLINYINKLQRFYDLKR